MRGETRKPFVHKGVVAAIQTVFQRARTGRHAWAPRSLHGRIDGRHVWRNDALASVDIFRDRHGASPTKLNVWLLVDASGSMSGMFGDGTRKSKAQDLTATLVEAFKYIPSVDLQVWQHDYQGERCIMYHVYERGMNKIAAMIGNGGYGNADGFAIDFLADRIKRSQRADSRSVLIVLSDGLPTDKARGNDRKPWEHVQVAAEDLRTAGVDVFAVDIAPAAKEYNAEGRWVPGKKRNSDPLYGEENVIPFDVDDPRCWERLALGFAQQFGEALA